MPRLPWVLLLAACASTRERGQDQEGRGGQAGPDEPAITYRDGIRTRNEDGGVRLRINGRVMRDWGDFDRDLEPAVQDTHEFRRVRLLAQGDIGESLYTRFQWEFSDSEEELLEWMVDYEQLSAGTLRVGYFREPLGLNAKTSSAYISLLERSSPSDAFTPGRNRGVSLRDRDRTWSWEVGVFREEDEAFGDLGDNRALTGRITYLPIRDEDDTRLLHLGAALSLRDTEDDGVQLGARPESHLLEPLVDTRLVAAETTSVLGLEGAWVRGRFSAQGEIFVAQLDLEGENATLGGAYLEGSWFLTGEHKAYRDSRSTFGRIDVHQPLFSGGTGAWELAARIARTDLDDAGVDGGVMDDLTLGLNWYLNGYTRVMLNYVVVDVEDSDIDGDFFMVRLQVGF